MKLLISSYEHVVIKNIEQMKIKFTLLLFLLLVTFSAIANYNLPKEKLKKVKLQLNNKTFELCVPKGYMLSINYTTEEI